MQTYTEFSAPIGKACFIQFEGVVTYYNTQRWSSSKTSATGGGGYIHPTYGGYISSPQVTTTIQHHERTDFWVKSDDGQEQRFTIGADILPAAVGHHVRFVYGGSAKQKEQASILFGKNNTSGHHAWFEKDDLWRWAREKNLIRYPLIYRILLRWIPFLILAYILFVWAPLTELMQKEQPTSPESFSFERFIALNQQWLGRWTPQLAFTTWYDHTDGGFWLGLIVFGIGLLAFWGFMEYIGYLFFGRWWRMLALRPIQKELSKITGYQAPTGLTNAEWLFSVAVTFGLIYLAWTRWLT